MRDPMHTRIADVLALLRKKPRTVIELHTLTELSLHTLRSLLRALEAENILRRSAAPQTGQGGSPDIWQWAD